MEVRRCVSAAEVAQCSFKDKAIAEIDVLLFNLLAYNVPTSVQVITVAFQVAIDAITKCLRLFAEDQQYAHSSSFFCTPLTVLKGNVPAMQVPVRATSSKQPVTLLASVLPAFSKRNFHLKLKTYLPLRSRMMIQNRFHDIPPSIHSQLY